MPVHVAPRSKYHATPTWVDGIRFASAREARRYGELKLLERAGLLWDLTCQPAFELHAVPLYIRDARARRELTNTAVVGVYRADFAYATKDGTIIEDAKGMRTSLYSWKKKHVELEYGVRIVEV